MQESTFPKEIQSHSDFGKAFDVDTSSMPPNTTAFNNVIFVSFENCQQGTRVYCVNTDPNHAYNVTLQVTSVGPGGGTFQSVKRNEAGGKVFLSCTQQGNWSYTWEVIGEVRL